MVLRLYVLTGNLLNYGAVGESLPPLSIDILNEKEYNYLYKDGKIMQSTESAIMKT